MSRALAELDLTAIGRAELLALLAAEATRVLDGDATLVWELDADTLRFVAVAPDAAPLVVELAEGERAALPAGPMCGCPPADDAWRPLYEATFGREEHGRALFVPLRLGGALIGAVVQRRGLADEPDLGAAEAFARQASAVLGNWRSLLAAERSEARLAALYETAGELSSRLDLETVLTAIVTRARALTRTPVSYIMLVDDAAESIYMRVTSGTTGDLFPRLRLGVGQGLGGWVAAEMHPLESDDYLNDPRFTHHGHVDQAVRAEGIRSILGVPLRGSGVFVGVLYVADRCVRTFSAPEEAALTSLADHAAVAIGNAALYERTMNALAEVEQANELTRAQNRRLERAERLNGELSQALLAGRGLTQVVELMSRFMDERVFVVDRHLRVLAAAGEPADPFGEQMAARGVAATLHRYRMGVGPSLDAQERSEPVVVAPRAPDRTRARLVVPIVSRLEVLGSLWVEVRPDELDEQRLLIAQGARVVALDLLMERAVAESERRVGSEFLSELFAAKASVPGGLQRRALELGIDLDHAHRVVVLGATPARSTRGEQVATRTRADLLKRLRAEPWCPFVSEWNNLIVALVRAEGDQLRPSVERLVAETESRDVTVHAVLSSTCDNATQYRREFVACDRVMRVVADQPGAGVVDLHESRVLGLLFRQGGEEVRAFVDAVLGPLAGHEARNRELIRTLEAYLAAAGSPGQTAAALHVHVNTVYYRLGRIRDALGLGLDDPRSALDLRVALLARRLVDDAHADDR